MPKQKFGCIYRLTNTKNGKKYIGKTVNYERRMKCHRYSKKTKTYLHNSIRKYGWDAFKKEILIDNVPEEDLDNLEISYIAVENTMTPNGYNLTIGGEGCSGYIHTDVGKKRMSKAQKKRRANREQFGSVFYYRRRKRWYVRGPSPELVSVGSYVNKEKAFKALKLFNETGTLLESDCKKTRTPNTGSIFKLNGRYQARVTIKGKRKGKIFDTVEECEAWIKETFENYEQNGTFDRERRKKGEGCIVCRKSGRYKAAISKEGIRCTKTFDTVEECEAWLRV